MILFLKHALEAYPIIAPLIFVIVRMLPIIIPPIPGIILDVIAIPIFGWLYGFILAGIAVMASSMVCFYIGRIYREPLLTRFVSLQKIHELETFYSERKKFWILVFLRMATSPLFDYINYIAGLTRIQPTTFFLSTFFSALPMGFLIYYFGNISFMQGPWGIMVFLICIGIVSLLIKQVSKKTTNCR